MELLTIEDIMKICGVGRPTATRLLRMKGCPTLPRVKGGKYLVPKDGFMAWLNGRDE